MKKNLIVLGCGMLLLGMASCNSESKHEETTTLPLCSLVTSEGENPTVSVSEGLYTFKMDYTNGTISVSSTNIEFGGEKYTIATDALKTTNIGDKTHGSILRISSPSPGNATGSGLLPLTDFSCSIYNYSVFDLPYVPDLSSTLAFQPVVITYKAGDYKVRTFQSDSFIKGQTNTTFGAPGGGMNGSYTNSSMLYRVVMDISKKTADVVIYNVQFAEQMPEMKAMMLKGLSLKFGADGFTVSGKDIIPSVLEGAQMTPNDKYPFNTFELKTSNEELTYINCDFTVAGRFSGSFSGTVLPVYKQQ